MYIGAEEGDKTLPKREKETEMARKQILVSDLSGEEIDAKEAAQVIIRYADARRGQIVLDVNASEVENLAERGQRQARRGRKPRAQAV